MHDTVEIETGANPTGSIIWLHGLGADGHDFEPIVPELRLPESLALRFVFPHSPVRPVTLNGGLPMRAWFDIRSLDREGQPDVAGIEASCALVDDLVALELERGVERDQIVLAGFSQGGVIAMHAALRRDAPLAGLMVLSSYLPLQSRLAGYPIRADLPVFVAHGEFDPVLTLDMGRESCARLQETGLRPEWHSYPMAHGVCAEEIRDISQWLQSVYSA